MEWTPEKAGNYDIYIDIMDEEGNVVTKKRTLKAIHEWKFEKVELKTAAIDIPYILYIGLRRKQYGNTYIFPYIV